MASDRTHEPPKRETRSHTVAHASGSDGLLGIHIRTVSVDGLQRRRCPITHIQNQACPHWPSLREISVSAPGLCASVSPLWFQIP